MKWGQIRQRPDVQREKQRGLARCADSEIERPIWWKSCRLAGGMRGERNPQDNCKVYKAMFSAQAQKRCHTDMFEIGGQYWSGGGNRCRYKKGQSPSRGHGHNFER